MESYLLTIFLTTLIFKGRRRYDANNSDDHHVNLPEELAHWITEVREIVSQNLFEKMDQSRLIQEEERVKQLFMHFDNFVTYVPGIHKYDSFVSSHRLTDRLTSLSHSTSKEGIVTDMSQFEWKESWTQIQQQLEPCQWNLYKHTLKPKFHQLQLEAIRSIIEKVKDEGTNQGIIHQWTTAHEQCLPLLANQANTDLFVQLWQDSTRTYIENNREQTSLHKAQAYQVRIFHHDCSFYCNVTHD